MSIVILTITFPPEALAIIEQSVRDVNKPRFDEMLIMCDSFRENNRELAARWVEWIVSNEKLPTFIEKLSSEPAGWFWRRGIASCSISCVPTVVFKFMKPAAVVKDTTFNEPIMFQAYINLILAGEATGITPEQAEELEKK